MPMCPLSTDWGNIADWFAVAVAGAGAWAVWRVTKASNRTAKASHELARQLKESGEEVQLRDRTILTALIYGELVGAKAHYEELLENLVADGSLDWAVGSEHMLKHLKELSKGPGLGRIKESTQRLNLLPRELGEQIAMGIGMTDLCPHNAEELLQARTREEQEIAFGRLVTSVDGASRAFGAAHLQMNKLLGIGQGG